MVAEQRRWLQQQTQQKVAVPVLEVMILLPQQQHQHQQQQHHQHQHRQQLQEVEKRHHGRLWCAMVAVARPNKRNTSLPTNYASMSKNGDVKCATALHAGAAPLRPAACGLLHVGCSTLVGCRAFFVLTWLNIDSGFMAGFKGMR